MSRAGAKSARPDDHGTPDTERAAGIARLVAAWEHQADRLGGILGTKAAGDAAMIDWNAERDALRPILAAVMHRLAEVGAWDVLARWNPDSDGWDVAMIDAWIAAAADTNAARWTAAVERRVIDATTTDDLRAFLHSHTLAVALAGAFITEAFSFGAHDAATKSGLTTKTWLVTSKNPRPSHAAQNGQTVDIDDVFSNGLRWPGDHYGNADENAGCTCRLDYGR